MNYKIDTKNWIKKITSQCRQILTLNVKSTRTQFGQMNVQYHIKKRNKKYKQNK